jgi:hypothetical protein
MDGSMGSLISATITVFVALIFARAAFHKLTGFTEFTGFVADYRLLPGRLVVPASMVVVGAELLAVLLEFVPGLQGWGLAVAAGMLGLYGVAMGINILRGRTFIECGCGGAVQPLSWALVGRNAVLVLLAVVGIATGPYALGAGDAIGAIAGGFGAWAIFLLAEQILANSSTARLTR